MKSVITHSLEETQHFAKEFLLSLNSHESEATVVGLYGNLGAGKTTFTQSVARELGITQPITSPTFVIEKIYEINHKNFARLVHIDAYRLEGGRELQNLNFEELVSNKNNLIFIEWPENVKDILPDNHIKLFCEFVDEKSRKFELQ